MPGEIAINTPPSENQTPTLATQSTKEDIGKTVKTERERAAYDNKIHRPALKTHQSYTIE